MGAKLGKAITEAARSDKIAKAARDFIIWGLLTVGRAIPVSLGIISSTTFVIKGSNATTYICEQRFDACGRLNVVGIK